MDGRAEGAHRLLLGAARMRCSREIAFAICGSHRESLRGAAQRGRVGHDDLSVPVWNDSHQPAQCVAPARQAGADCADRHIKNLGDLLVAHPFEADEKDDRALLLRQLSDRAFEIAQFKALALMRRARQQRLGLAEPDRRSFAHRAANLIDVLIMEDCEQPSPQVRPILPKVEFAERPRQTILNKIVGCGDIASQRPRVSPKARDLGLDTLVNITHEFASHPSRPPQRPC